MVRAMEHSLTKLANIMLERTRKQRETMTEEEYVSFVQDIGNELEHKLLNGTSPTEPTGLLSKASLTD